MKAYDELQVAVFKMALCEACLDLSDNQNPLPGDAMLGKVGNFFERCEPLLGSNPEFSSIMEPAEAFLSEPDNPSNKEELINGIMKLLKCSNLEAVRKQLQDANVAIAHHKMKDQGKIDTELAQDTKWSPSTMHLAVAAKNEALKDKTSDQIFLCMKTGNTLNPQDNELAEFLKFAKDNPDLVRDKTFHIAVREFTSLGQINEYGDVEEMTGHWVYLGLSFDHQGQPIGLFNDYFTASDVVRTFKELRDNAFNTIQEHFPNSRVYLYANEFNIQNDATNCARYTLNTMTAMKNSQVFTELRSLHDPDSKDQQQPVMQTYNNNPNLHIINYKTLPQTTIKLLRGTQSVSTLKRLGVRNY